MQRKKYIIVTLTVVVVLLASLFIFKLIIPLNKDSSNITKTLTSQDLDNPKVGLGSDTSDASVETLSKELKSSIDKQIANKQNPIDTLTTLVGVLCGTTNANRAYQCIDYIKEFLAAKMDTLRFSSDLYGEPDELQVTYWRAQLYADLVASYKLIMQNNFLRTDAKKKEAVTEQLKYIDLYLALAKDQHNWGMAQTTEDGRTWYLYDYDNVEELTEWRAQLVSGGGQ